MPGGSDIFGDSERGAWCGATYATTGGGVLFGSRSMSNDGLGLTLSEEILTHGLMVKQVCAC